MFHKDTLHWDLYANLQTEHINLDSYKSIQYKYACFKAISGYWSLTVTCYIPWIHCDNSFSNSNVQYLSFLFPTNHICPC